VITRGHFIGFILDELTSIAHQVDTRCSLGLTDINRFLEDFFKEIINAIEGINLVNLNSTRSNTPGLDLGDQAARIAYQVTSQKTSAKVNETLVKITEEQLDDYDDIRVLVIGTKQRSYTLDDAQCKRCGFSKEKIKDVIDLCKESMDLKLDDLQRLFELVKSQVVRVKIELETPAPDGTFPTSMKDYIEAVPKPRIGSWK
jgi:hypothetical protein